MVYAEQMPMTGATSISAPVLGWRTDLPEDQMPPGTALIFDNLISDGTTVKSRGGYAEFKDTTTGQAVDTLALYTYQTTSQLIAISNGTFYNVTGTVTSLGSGFSLSNWQWTQHNNFTVFVNGTDTPQKWDGTTLTAWAPTGITPSEVINLATYKERLFGVLKNSLTFVYGAPQAVEGAWLSFPLDSIAERGGVLLAIGTYSTDTGSGPDDYLCFFTSNGEMIVYTGVDPSAPASWSLIGVYALPRPIGVRCYTKPRNSTGVVITEHGYVTLDEIATNVPNVQRKGRAVENAAVAAHDRFESVFGWEVADYSHGNLTLCNVPDGVGASDYNQFAVQGSGAWSRFTNMNARTWQEFEDKMYFGGLDGKVYQALTGFQDGTANLEFDVKTAYEYFGNRAQLKTFLQVRPVYRSLGQLPISVDFDVDFEDQAPPYEASPTTTTGTPWGSPWGSPWGTSVVLTKNWLDVRGEGYCGALRLRGSTTAQPFQWYSWEVQYEVGGII